MKMDTKDEKVISIIHQYIQNHVDFSFLKYSDQNKIFRRIGRKLNSNCDNNNTYSTNYIRNLYQEYVKQLKDKDDKLNKQILCSSSDCYTLPNSQRSSSSSSSSSLSTSSSLIDEDYLLNEQGTCHFINYKQPNYLLSMDDDSFLEYSIIDDDKSVVQTVIPHINSNDNNMDDQDDNIVREKTTPIFIDECAILSPSDLNMPNVFDLVDEKAETNLYQKQQQHYNQAQASFQNAFSKQVDNSTKESNSNNNTDAFDELDSLEEKKKVIDVLKCINYNKRSFEESLKGTNLIFHKSNCLANDCIELKRENFPFLSKFVRFK